MTVYFNFYTLSSTGGINARSNYRKSINATASYQEITDIGLGVRGVQEMMVQNGETVPINVSVTGTSTGDDATSHTVLAGQGYPITLQNDGRVYVKTI
jgi:hypothetical protein